MVPKVIIDNDAGQDDAFAIFMALEAHRRNEIEICAITTVNGNTRVENVNKNVFRILDTAELLQIPVYSGASQPLVCPFEFATVPFHGYDGFGDAVHESSLPSTAVIQKEFAPLAIVQIVNKYPGEVILIALGPLTNIAISINIDPSISGKLKDFYLMGGNIYGNGNITMMAEFNFFCDPEAAKVVLDRTTIPIKITPWETCSEAVHISYEERIQLGSTNSKAARLMNLVEAKTMYRKNYSYYITCDQFPVAWMLEEWTKLTNENEPLVLETTSVYATVELSGLHSRGLMVIDNTKKVKRTENVRVLKNVNKKVYMNYLKLAFM